MPISFKQLTFALEACQRQRNCTHLDLYNMAATIKVASQLEHVTRSNILILGTLVNPDTNARGWRTVPVMFQTYGSDPNSLATRIGMNPQLIDRAINHLIAVLNDITPDEFYQRFEEIHPFLDGNGRLGEILWNMLNHTLTNPTHPPEFKQPLTS